MIGTMNVSDKKNKSFAGKQLTLLSIIKSPLDIQPSDTIIYVHIPKCGGTNLVHVAEAWSKASASFKTVRFAVPQIPNRSPNLITSDWSGGFKTALDELKNDPK